MSQKPHMHDHEVPPPLFGVVGMPHVVANSLSPTMFAAAFRECGINAHYVPLSIREDSVEAALRCLPELGFRGVNVTMPYKPVAAQVADTRSELVESTGIANTLVIQESGRVHAEATDGAAVVDAVEAAGGQLRGATVTVLGAGGAAVEAAVACASAGAARMHLWNRSAPRLQQLHSTLRRIFPDLVLQLHDRLPIHVAAHVLVSAVPRESFTREELSGLHAGMVVVDLAYRADRRPTTLVEAARHRAVACVDGREILARQGAAAFRIWFGVEAPTEVMVSAVT